MKTALFTLIAALAFGAAVKFTPRGLTEIKAKPSASSETVRLVKAGEPVEVKSTLADSAGLEWYMVRTSGGTEGFVQASALEVLTDGKEGEIVLDDEAMTEEKKRRLNEVKKHTEWSMRIKRVVRNGAICLKMTQEQLVASWQEPYERTSGFILGSGDVRIFFYRKASPIAVVLKNNEVIGWSERE